MNRWVGEGGRPQKEVASDSHHDNMTHDTLGCGFNVHPKHLSGNYRF